MPSYTLALKRVLEIEQDNGNGLRIGLDAYPIFDPSHRDVLNRKIIAHFYNREIGQESISLWKFALARRMNEIMPYWNKIYESELIQFDPLATFNLKTMRDDTTKEKTVRSGSTTNGSDTTSKSLSVSSDTPQNELPDDWVENADYASNGAGSRTAVNVSGTGGSNDESDATTDAEGSSTTTGFQGSAADLLTKYRGVLLNVDRMVLGQLTDLFMLIWDNGIEMLPDNGPLTIGYW